MGMLRTEKGESEYSGTYRVRVTYSFSCPGLLFVSLIQADHLNRVYT